MLYLFCFVLSYVYFVSYLTINISAITIAAFILLLLLLLYCYHQITVTTDKLLREKSFLGVVEWLINIFLTPLVSNQ